MDWREWDLNLLLDTHAFIWWLANDDGLSRVAKRAIESEANTVFVSAASAFEVTTKYRLGKLPEAAELALNFESIVQDEGFRPLPISLGHATRAGSLRGAHKDPFDRMLVAQSLSEAMFLVSNEVPFDTFGVNRLW